MESTDKKIVLGTILKLAVLYIIVMLYITQRNQSWEVMETNSKLLKENIELQYKNDMLNKQLNICIEFNKNKE